MILAYLCLPLPLLEPMPPLVGVYFETYTLNLNGDYSVVTSGLSDTAA